MLYRKNVRYMLASLDYKNINLRHCIGICSLLLLFFPELVSNKLLQTVMPHAHIVCNLKFRCFIIRENPSLNLLVSATFVETTC